MDSPHPVTASTQTHDWQISALVERTNSQLLRIVRRHFNTQFATQAPSLSAFRDAISARGGIEVDATLLADFRAHVPLSNYDDYKPFMDRFDRQPCKKEDVENLFSPGLPSFIARSSSTTGEAPKFLARYAKVGAAPSRSPFFDPKSKTPLAALVYCGSVDVKEIMDESGRVIKKIPVCLGSGQRVRSFFGWKFVDDESRMSATLPYYAVPWAATIIGNLPSLLTIHGLFFLLHRDVDRFFVPFATLFVDLICCIEKHWITLVTCIRNGILPDLEGIDRVREYLQAQLHADPERAVELLEIGPPFSIDGWATRVWPNIRELCTVCTGSWDMMLPKIRSIIGPDTVISSPGYGSSESAVAVLHDVSKPDEFILPNNKVIEFLDVSQGDSIEGLRQAWEVEVGKRYEPVMTTVHGLWRYQLGDVVTIIGFHHERHSPIFKISGRKSMKIRLPHAEIADFHLLEAIRATTSEDTIIVQEFTTLVDTRASPPAVCYIVELTRAPGPKAHLVSQKLFDALVATDSTHQLALEHGQIRLPTICIVKPGTFLEYRFHRAKMENVSSGQFKIPLVLGNPYFQEWIMERVIQEL